MEDNDKDTNDDKGISALEIDRELGFSQGHQAHHPPDDDNKENDNSGGQRHGRRQLQGRQR